MGSLELELLLKYGLPVAVKLLQDGKDTNEVVEVVTKVITGIKDKDIAEVFVKADDKQTKGIIEGLFGIITGVGDALGGLVKAIGGLFGGK